VLLGLSSVAVLVLVSLGAAADLHPSGYDKNCSLCMFTKSPPIQAAVPLIVPSVKILCGYVTSIPGFVCQEPVLYSGSSRAPPR